MLKWFNKKRKRKGFTLVELVVVIAILGILGGIAVPKLSGFRDRAEAATDHATAVTLVKAAELYEITSKFDPLEPEDSEDSLIKQLIEADMIEKGEYEDFKLKFVKSGDENDGDRAGSFIVKKGDLQVYPEETTKDD